VELACKFSNPKARVSWYKNKLEVFLGLKYKLSNEDGVFRLFINNAAMEDAGKYTCQANNLETSCYLTVEGWIYSRYIVYCRGCQNLDSATRVSEIQYVFGDQVVFSRSGETEL